jgi:serpin B
MKKLLFVLILWKLGTLNTLAQDKLVKANNDFAFKIYKATRSDSSNLFISPFSLHIALSIANRGAMGATRIEMDNLLGTNDINDRDSLYKLLIKKTTNLNDKDFEVCSQFSENKSGENTLSLANSLWINDEIHVDEVYKQTVKNNYNSDVSSFSKENATATDQKINNWVSEKTQNKIQEISGFSPDVKLGILNAIYFSGDWQIPFNKKKTKQKNFHTIKKDKVKVNFMNNQSFYEYFEDEDIQSLGLPYKCDQFRMIVILPKQKLGITKVEEKFNSEYFDQIKKKSRANEIILSLPKLKIETELSPIEEIKRMGYNEMFSEKADFSGISKLERLQINQLIHKTFIDLNEKKTEAAAVTKIEMVLTGGVGVEYTPPPPKIFNADHPFLFFIIDTRTEAILFIGRYVK